MMDDDDAQLIGRFLEGNDSGAFGALVERHLGLVYRTALRLAGGDAHRAEDVAQAVFVLVARKAEALRGRGSVAGWLYETTRRIARDVRRSEERRKRREEGAVFMSGLLEDGAGAGGREAEASAGNWEKVRPVLDEALGELSAADREVVLLRFFGGKAFGEIGAALRLSEDAARMRAARALEKLRGLLERRGVKSTSAALGVVLAGDAAMGAPAGLAATVSHGALAGVASLAGGAGAAFGVGASFGAIGFMSAIKTVGVVSIVSAAAFFAVIEIAASRDAEAALQGVRAEHARLAKKTEEAERALKLAEQDAARRAAEKAAAAATLAKAEQEPAVDPVARGDAFMAKHPEVKAAFIAKYRADVVEKYLPLYRDLKLTAEQRAQFEEIQLSNEIPGLSLDDGRISLRIPRRLKSAERNQRLKALLGEDGYRALSRFEQESGMRARAAKTAGLLFDGGAPVTREQGEALAGVYSREKRTPGMTATQYWKKIRAEAGAFLSPEQLEVLNVEQLRDEAAWADQQAAKRSIEK